MIMIMRLLHPVRGAALASLLFFTLAGCASSPGKMPVGGSPGSPDASGAGGAAVPPSGGGAGGDNGGGGSAGAPAAGGTGGTGGGSPAATGDAGAPVVEGGVPSTPGLEKIFDGTSFDNWVYNPTAWKIVDRAMVGKVTGGQSQAFTKKDYSNFRLIVWSRMVNGNDHLGICFWGNRPPAGNYGFGSCLLVIPPNAAIWDYLTNTDNPKPNYQVGMAEWHQTEILANRDTGKVLVAVNGKLLHEYQDPAAKLPRRKPGPIGMQIHKAGTESEYRDIEIEVDPKSDMLITVPH
jgi:hypothetical protein